jgi:hypothetical protein
MCDVDEVVMLGESNERLYQHVTVRINEVRQLITTGDLCMEVGQKILAVYERIAEQLVMLDSGLASIAMIEKLRAGGFKVQVVASGIVEAVLPVSPEEKPQWN